MLTFGNLDRVNTERIRRSQSVGGNDNKAITKDGQRRRRYTRTRWITIFRLSSFSFRLFLRKHFSPAFCVKRGEVSKSLKVWTTRKQLKK